MSELYTFFLDYDGGTFVTQVEGNSIHDAYDKWIAMLPLTEMNVSLSTEIELEDVGERFSKIVDLKNVWCTTLVIENKMAIGSVVLTRST